MFGQAPYVINGILSYNRPDIGLNTTISYNVQGAKLVLTSIDAAPDVYELPRHSLNFKIGKSINKYFSASLRVRNILNTPVRRAYNYDGEYLLDFDKFRWGTDFNVGISYKL